MKHTIPPEQELQAKDIELSRMESLLAQHELDLITLLAIMRSFECLYLREIGSRYARLDEVNAQYAEAYARLHPEDAQAAIEAKLLRAGANRSAQDRRSHQQNGKRSKFKPWESLKKLYREIAKMLHPDLTTNETERARRQLLMTEVNLAYEQGNEERLKAILLEWEAGFECSDGEGIDAKLHHIHCKLAQINIRLHEIMLEVQELKNADLYSLQVKVTEAQLQGCDLLKEMARAIDGEINEAKNRLTALSKMPLYA